MNQNRCGIMITGGGLGGLTAAVALLQRDIPFVVFEKSAELRELGAGLSVWPNATRVVRDLGLLDEVVAASQVIERLLLRTSGGELISEVCAPGKSEAPTVCIHRRELLSILAAKIPPECIRWRSFRLERRSPRDFRRLGWRRSGANRSDSGSVHLEA